jgi:hypothetical protein
MAHIDCPNCSKPTLAVDEGWRTPRARHNCPNCGCRFEVAVDSAFDGESSYPVIEIQTIDPKDERIAHLESANATLLEQHSMAMAHCAAMERSINAALLLIPRWIRVEDGLPKDQQDVLIWAWGTDLKLCTYWVQGYSSVFSDGDGFCESPGEHVTHWMPLPEPPK